MAAMTWLTLLTLAAVVLIGLALLKRRPSEPNVEEFDAEEITRAAIALHKIGKNFDAAWVKHELRRDSAQLRRELAEEMDSPEQFDG